MKICWPPLTYWLTKPPYATSHIVNPYTFHTCVSYLHVTDARARARIKKKINADSLNFPFGRWVFPCAIPLGHSGEIPRNTALIIWLPTRHCFYTRRHLKLMMPSCNLLQQKFCHQNCIIVVIHMWHVHNDHVLLRTSQSARNEFSLASNLRFEFYCTNSEPNLCLQCGNCPVFRAKKSTERKM